jgi:hypothetical protein
VQADEITECIYTGIACHKKKPLSWKASKLEKQALQVWTQMQGTAQI